MQEMICTTCGHVGRPKTKTQGNFFIEVILWLTFIVPGVIYTIWRMTSKQRVCRSCGSSLIVPKDSPVGRNLLANLKNKG